MTEKEAYQVLGLTPGATLRELKKKYRELMIQVHPDSGIHTSRQIPSLGASPYTQARCSYTAQEINCAYSILKEKSLPIPIQSPAGMQTITRSGNRLLSGMPLSMKMPTRNGRSCNMRKNQTVLSMEIFALQKENTCGPQKKIFLCFCSACISAVNGYWMRAMLL